MFNRQVRQTVALELISDKKTLTLDVKPISYRWPYRNLCYNYWVDKNETRVDEWSKGQVGYLHIAWMGGDYIKKFKSEIFTQSHLKKAIIIDIRNNPGGWPPQEIFNILMRQKYCQCSIGGRLLDEPNDIWQKPVVLLTNTKAKSASEMTFYAFQHYKLGKVVGGQTPGYVIATPQVKLLNGFGFKIPMERIIMSGGENLENLCLQPDVAIENLPTEESLFAETDEQLKRAVEVNLAELD